MPMTRNLYSIPQKPSVPRALGPTVSNIRRKLDGYDPLIVFGDENCVESYETEKKIEKVIFLYQKKEISHFYWKGGST